MKRYGSAFSFVIILFILSRVQFTSAQVIPSCPALVRNALADVEAVCSATGRNQICYGHSLLLAEQQPHIADLLLRAPGDMTEITNLRRVRLFPMNLDLDQWGLALMRVQANLPDSLPGQNVLFMLFGNVELSPEPPSVQYVSNSNEMTLAPQPIRAFRVQTGFSEPQCDAMPPDGILIQTPHGLGRVELTINDVNLNLGSTVFFQTRENTLTVSTIEGSALIEAAGGESIALPGSSVQIPLDSNLEPAAAPMLPEPYDTAVLSRLPLASLDRPVELPPALSETELRPIRAAVQHGDASTLIPEDDASAPVLTGEPVLTGGNRPPACPGNSCNSQGNPGNNTNGNGNGNANGSTNGNGGNNPNGNGGNCPGSSCNSSGAAGNGHSGNNGNGGNNANGNSNNGNGNGNANGNANGNGGNNPNGNGGNCPGNSCNSNGVNGSGGAGGGTAQENAGNSGADGGNSGNGNSNGNQGNGNANGNGNGNGGNNPNGNGGNCPGNSCNSNGGAGDGGAGSGNSDNNNGNGNNGNNGGNGNGNGNGNSGDAGSGNGGGNGNGTGGGNGNNGNGGGNSNGGGNAGGNGNGNGGGGNGHGNNSSASGGITGVPSGTQTEIHSGLQTRLQTGTAGLKPAVFNSTAMTSKAMTSKR